MSQHGVYGAEHQPQHEQLSDIGPLMLLNYGEINMHIMENLSPLTFINILSVFMAALVWYKVNSLT
jgi:hypothetical protein